MHYSLRLIFLSLIVIFVGTGCASHYVVPSFEGDKRPLDQVGLLKVPESIKILRVNGRSQDQFLLNSLALDYQLLPGGNRIEYQYASLWAIAGGSVKDEGKSSELVKSKVQEVKFNVEPGKIYHFDFKRAANRADAKRLAESFESVLKDDKNQLVATGVLYVEKKEVDQTVGKALLNVAPPVAPVGSEVLTNVEALKVLWGRAGAAEKKEFLRWALEK